MKIYVLGSNSFMIDMVKTADELKQLGYDGWIHQDYIDLVNGKMSETLKRSESGEHADVKRENQYLKVHYRNICESDAILIVNLEKNGINNYIGGNALIEMGQAYVNDKIIFLLNDIPEDVSYVDEIVCMDPICLHGDLQNINKI